MTRRVPRGAPLLVVLRRKVDQVPLPRDDHRRPVHNESLPEVTRVRWTSTTPPVWPDLKLIRRFRLVVSRSRFRHCSIAPVISKVMYLRSELWPTTRETIACRLSH